VRHAVILGHPSPTSFNASVARCYAQEARSVGEDAEVRDLYALGFDPRLTARELPWAADFAPPADVETERAVIASADVVAFVYPLWFNAPPAMIKGYVERVFGMGFAYAPDEGGTQPLLAGKRLIAVSSSGAPGQWIEHTGAIARLRAGFDEHVAAVCGLSVVDHLHLGGVTPGIRPDAAEALFDRVRAMVRRHFAPATAAAG
jgi:NAD(P)H dehydrogenase (quinone)